MTTEIIDLARQSHAAIKERNFLPENFQPSLENLADFLVRSSLLPTINPELIPQLIRQSRTSDGEIPLALHAISCLNFIKTEAGARIAKIDTKSSRWKIFSQKELPNFLSMFAVAGIRTVFGFCISDMGDFIDDKQLGIETIPQNIAAMTEDLAAIHHQLKRQWGWLAPEIKIMQHSQLFNQPPLKTAFDQMFNSGPITEDDLIQFRLWLLENATTPEADPFLTSASEAEALWQIFASGVLYAADASTSAQVMQTAFPMEKIQGTIMLNLFPGNKADAVIQKVFIDALVQTTDQPAIISPFANAGRWQSDPVKPSFFPQSFQERPFDWSRPILEILADLLQTSKSQVRTLILQGAVKIDGQKFTHPDRQDFTLDLIPHGSKIIQVGKSKQWEINI